MERTIKQKVASAVALGVAASAILGPLMLVAFDALANWVGKDFKISPLVVIGTIIGGASCFLLALAGYWFREKKRLWYGSLEVGVAMVTGGAAIFNGLSSPQSPFVSLLAFMAAIYIGVRGFDNAYQAVKKAEEASAVKKAEEEGSNWKPKQQYSKIVCANFTYMVNYNPTHSPHS